jgi:spore germination protein
MSYDRVRTLATLMAAAAAASCASGGRSGFVTPTTGDHFFVAGYHPYWAGDAWVDYPTDVLDELFFFELEAGADGTITDRHGWPDEWLAMVQSSFAEDVQVVPTISMHDADGFEALFGNDERVIRLVDAIAGLVEASPGLSGIHLDFEVFRPVELAARDGYTAFVARLADRMKAINPSLSLSAFTLAFDDDEVYNERALGELTDYLVVQGYDYHSAGEATAGPVAGLAGWGRLNWATVVDRFEEFGVPARKIVMAVPLYGYEWPVVSDEPGAETRGSGVTIPYAAPADVLPDLPRARAQAERHGIHRDPTSGAPYYSFRDQTGWYQGWFDDAESLRAKYDFVRTRGLGGIAIFPLAYGDEALWKDLREAFARPRF